LFDGDPRVTIATLGIKLWMNHVTAEIQRVIASDENEAFQAFLGSKKYDSRAHPIGKGGFCLL
jgi:hypothetical protein